MLRERFFTKLQLKIKFIKKMWKLKKSEKHDQKLKLI